MTTLTKPRVTPVDLLWVAWRRRDLIGGYRYPLWLVLIGSAAWVLTIYIGYKSLTGLGDLF